MLPYVLLCPRRNNSSCFCLASRFSSQFVVHHWTFSALTQFQSNVCGKWTGSPRPLHSRVKCASCVSLGLALQLAWLLRLSSESLSLSKQKWNLFAAWDVTMTNLVVTVQCLDTAVASRSSLLLVASWRSIISTELLGPRPPTGAFLHFNASPAKLFGIHLRGQRVLMWREMLILPRKPLCKTAYPKSNIWYQCKTK